jgi:hypothetical protein
MAFGTELQDVIAHFQKYNGREVELVGIARVKGYFYLFADKSAAADLDLSRALLVRQNGPTRPEYTRLDRQWVHVTGVISSKPRHGWDQAQGLLLKQAGLLQDRPEPGIRDPMVLAIFQNATSEALVIELRSPSKATYQKFWLGPHETDITEILEGQAVAASLKGPVNVPASQRETNKPLASGEIKFRQLLSADYEYSPEWSDKRRFYYRITDDRIERIPASEARGWKIN